MKKIFSLIAVLVLLSGCDDGDMTFKTFDFSDAGAPIKCTLANNNGVLYYKVNGTELLILELADGQLINAENIDDDGNNIPREITISGNTRITYRNYATAPNSSTICTTLTNGTTDYEDQWTGVGTLSVITTATKDKDTGKIKGYGHQVTLKNVTFTKGDESITINNSLFGTISIDNGFAFNFSEGQQPPIENCSQNVLYIRKGSEALVLTITNPSEIFKNEIGSTSLEINNTDQDNLNRIEFTAYQSSVNPDRICRVGGSELPNPIAGQRWTVSQGTINVKTTRNEAAGRYVHSIYLTDVTFVNRDNNETFELESIVVVTEDGYFFGEYSPQ